MIAWSLVPLAVTLLLWLPLFAAFGLEALNLAWPAESAEALLTLPCQLLIVIAPFWVAIIQIVGVSEAMKMSKPKAFACLLLLGIPAAILTIAAT